MKFSGLFSTHVVSLLISLPITVARDGADADCPSGPLLTLREVLHTKGREIEQIMGKGKHARKPQASPIASFFLPSPQCTSAWPQWLLPPGGSYMMPRDRRSPSTSW